MNVVRSAALEQAKSATLEILLSDSAVCSSLGTPRCVRRLKKASDSPESDINASEGITVNARRCTLQSETKSLKMNHCSGGALEELGGDLSVRGIRNHARLRSYYQRDQ